MSEERKLSDRRADKSPKSSKKTSADPSDQQGAATARDLPKGETVDYIASLLENLRDMAEKADLSFLAYLIGIAFNEAESEKAREDAS